MNSYIARVVLHRTDGSDDYADLHAEMLKIGFRRDIEDQEKVKYRLPSGTYHYDVARPVSGVQHRSIDAVYNSVKAAIEKVMEDETLYIRQANRPPSILISQADETTWSGLAPLPTPKILPRRKS
ncbi:hypothetical protein [Hymenobacter pini]|uniref:hypothetical protein n=1 Tax=Hymenobacter pini TaxID=2880879 RepID=UPI001CF2E70E|nr:hypothetical protein [Hymenobacter pini]MCA8830506.1 hypothetical protein [Hymenobacter pini]